MARLVSLCRQFYQILINNFQFQIYLLSAVTIVVAQTGTNYQTGDGHYRSENIDQEGNVKGQYSYVDPNGKTVTVKYSAGKNGFQV